MSPRICHLCKDKIKSTKPKADYECIIPDCKYRWTLCEDCIENCVATLVDCKIKVCPIHVKGFCDKCNRRAAMGNLLKSWKCDFPGDYYYM